MHQPENEPYNAYGDGPTVVLLQEQGDSVMMTNAVIRQQSHDPIGHRRLGNENTIQVAKSDFSEYVH